MAGSWIDQGPTLLGVDARFICSAKMAPMAAVETRDYDPTLDERWAEELLDTTLAGRWQARGGEMLDVLDYSGLVAVDGSERIGLLCYQRVGADCEVIALAAAHRHQGVGTALLEALKVRLPRECVRIWLVTTNDNLDALRFYQRRGFRLAQLRAGAVDDARRRLKPGIPLTGAFGIPLRDEFELELPLGGPQPAGDESGLVGGDT